VLGDEFAAELLDDKVDNKVISLRNKKFVPELGDLKSKPIDPTTNKVWSSPEYQKVTKQLTKFQEILKKSGLPAAKNWVKNNAKFYEPFWAQFIRNWYANLFFNWKKVQMTNIKKAKEFIQNDMN
jgi:hypothetical protein